MLDKEFIIQVISVENTEDGYNMLASSNDWTEMFTLTKHYTQYFVFQDLELVYQSLSFKKALDFYVTLNMLTQ